MNLSRRAASLSGSKGDAVTLVGTALPFDGSDEGRKIMAF
jgi:hypothetical protein